jgi:hypothetical protein
MPLAIVTMHETTLEIIDSIVIIWEKRKGRKREDKVRDVRFAV